ncbi:amino acid ABC transporter permease [Viridibacillus sp. YIM B01967]|uniref:Amino acid ABC transporter permease n=1 Tax=Viridibacillus soli TaxID=2798301 RepID=A0ABS1HB73_9BACL|nr:amino acid ABC transporter permease [Viridibacillus soli]MBK3496660.1 amino acid ABC transporter permease [Viridibacillus soli]
MLNSGINVLFEGINMQRLLMGLLVTARVAVFSIIIGCTLGTIIGVIRTSKSKIIKMVFRIYLELFRIIPILVWLFVFYFVLPADFNINLDAEIVSIIVFSLWGAAEMSDIVRGALISLPKHQVESGKAIGLNTIQLYWYILIPQSLKRTLPSAINLATRMIKTTALLVMIGVIEVVKVGQQIIEHANLKNPTASFWVYGFIFFLYFIMCYPLSKLSQRLERKWAS